MDQSESTPFDWKEFSQRTWVVVVSGLVFPPLGVFLSWRKTDWPPKAKWIATGLLSLLFLWRMGGSDKKEQLDPGNKTVAMAEVEKQSAKGGAAAEPLNQQPSAGDSNGITNSSAAITDEQFNRVQSGVKKFVVEDTLGKPLSRDTQMEEVPVYGPNGEIFGKEHITVIVFTYRLTSHPNKLARFVFRGRDTNPPLDSKRIVQP